MENTRADYLYGTGFTVVQTENGYHFNSDTELLGLFMQAKPAERVLDIGCHSGALMLYAAHSGAVKIEGIDLYEEVTKLAEENMKRCGVSAVVHTGRVQDLKTGPYDLIVCNPPYFKNSGSMVPKDRILHAARHETELGLDELFAAVRRLLSERGRFCLVHRVSRLQDIITAAGNAGFGITRMRIAYRTKDGPGQSVLLELRRGAKREVTAEPPAFLDDRSTFITDGKGNNV
ncbi:MAG: methyltransferase [Solobacterium sp.]|nr:methyltransferase [Solobacterium sp.]